MIESLKIPYIARLLSAIRSIHKLFLDADDPAELTQQICETIQSTCAVPLVAIVLPPQSSGAPTVGAAAGAIDGGSALLEAIRNGKDPCHCITDPEYIPRTEDMMTCSGDDIGPGLPRHKYTCLRLRYGETTYGTLLIAITDGEAETSDVQQAMKEIAADIAFALATLQQAAHNRHLRAEAVQMRRYVETFFEQAPLAIVYASPEGVVRRCNRSFVKFLSYTQEEEMAGVDLRSVMHRVPRKVETFFRQSSHQHGTAERILTTFQTCQDTLVVGDTTFLSIPETSDESASVLVVINDITRRVAVERKLKRTYIRLQRSEMRYRSLFEDSADAVFVTSHDGTLVDINHAGARMLGYGDPNEVIGMNVSRFYQNPADRSIFLEEMEKHGYVKNLEVTMRTKDGSIVYGSESTSIVKDSDPGNLHYQGVIHDITQRIHAEQELMRRSLELSQANVNLKQMQRELVQKEKLASIGEISAGIAHEINNPLGFVRSNISSLQKYTEEFRHFLSVYSEYRDSPELVPALADAWDRSQLGEILADVPDLFSETEDGVRRIVAIVSNLTDFSRAGSDEMASDYDINSGINSTLIIARNEYKYVAEIELNQNSVPTIRCNANQINQVLLTLVINAGQAIASSNREDGMISISTWNDDDYVYCRIEDNGPGVPDDVKERVFDTFFTTKPAGKGTGLGLSIAYDIVVNRHNGRLSVADAPSGGASFTLQLPRTGE